jgi:hypothetical protein
MDETEAVLNILGQIHSGMTSEEDISDQDQVNTLNTILLTTLITLLTKIFYLAVI